MLENENFSFAFYPEEGEYKICDMMGWKTKERVKIDGGWKMNEIKWKKR
jgi:hypothetical protein